MVPLVDMVTLPPSTHHCYIAYSVQELETKLSDMEALMNDKQAQLAASAAFEARAVSKVRLVLERGRGGFNRCSSK